MFEWKRAGHQRLKLVLIRLLGEHVMAPLSTYIRETLRKLGRKYMVAGKALGWSNTESRLQKYTRVVSKKVMMM